jgi:hypothetical protein
MASRPFSDDAQVVGMLVVVQIPWPGPARFFR